MKKVVEKGYKIIIYVFAISFLVVCSFLSMLKTCKYIDDKVVVYADDKFIRHILVLLGAIAISVLIQWLYKKKDIFSWLFSDRALKIYFWFNFTCTMGFVIATQLNPIYDPAAVSWIAENIVKNDYRELFFDTMSDYMSRYSQQKGIVLYICLIFKIFGIENYLALQIINVIARYVTYYYLYKILKLIWGEGLSTRIAWTAVLFFFPYSIITPFIYGNFIACMFIMIAVWHALQFCGDCSWKNAIFSGISIGLSVQFKKNYLIFMVAILIVCVFDGLIKSQRKVYRIILTTIAGVVLCSGLVNLTYDKISKLRKGEGLPAVSWVAMGLDIENVREYGVGIYNGLGERFYEQYNGDSKQIKKAANEKISQSLSYFASNPQFALEYFSKKLMITWAEPTYEVLWNLWEMPHEYENTPKYISSIYTRNTKSYNIILKILNIIQSLVYLGSIIYMIFNFRNFDVKKTIFVLTFCGAFLFHLFWETDGRYVFVYFVMLIPVAVKGFCELSKNLYNLFKNGKIWRT